jgi:hypothetical protein
MRTHWEQQKSHHPHNPQKKKNLGFDMHVVSLPLATRDFLFTCVFLSFWA